MVFGRGDTDDGLTPFRASSLPDVVASLLPHDLSW